MPIDLPTLARKYKLPLAANGQSAECPGGRIVAFGDAELAFTGEPIGRLPKHCRSIYRTHTGQTFAFHPELLGKVLAELAA
jgi:hypothetical protein